MDIDHINVRIDVRINVRIQYDPKKMQFRMWDRQSHLYST